MYETCFRKDDPPLVVASSRPPVLTYQPASYNTYPPVTDIRNVGNYNPAYGYNQQAPTAPGGAAPIPFTISGGAFSRPIGAQDNSQIRSETVNPSAPSAPDGDSKTADPLPDYDAPPAYTEIDLVKPNKY